MKHFTLKTKMWFTVLVVMAMSAFSMTVSAQSTDMFYKSEPEAGVVTELPAVVQVFLQNSYTEARMMDQTVDITKDGKLFKTVPVEKDEDSKAIYVKVGKGVTEPGEYKILFPEQMFSIEALIDFASWTWGELYNEAFDITYTIEGQQPGGGDEDMDGTVATFDFTTSRSESFYLEQGAVLKADYPAITMTLNEVSKDVSDYSFSYLTTYGCLQIRGAKFTIAAPASANIKKIEFVEAGYSQDLDLDIENLEADGYAEGIWKGLPTASVAFKTAIKTVYNYTIIENEDGEEEEILTGSSESISGARIAKIFVTFDGDAGERVDGIVAVTTKTDNVIYDLSGRRVANAQSGLYIANGKKVLR